MTTYLGKSCSFCLPRVPFVNCGQFMYLVISLLVLRAGCGIWLYQFLIIAHLFTLETFNLALFHRPAMFIAKWYSNYVIHARVKNNGEYSEPFPIRRLWTDINTVQHMSRDMTKPTKWVRAQRRLRSAWASAQTDQRRRCPHEETLEP